MKIDQREFIDLKKIGNSDWVKIKTKIPFLKKCKALKKEFKLLNSILIPGKEFSFNVDFVLDLGSEKIPIIIGDSKDASDRFEFSKKIFSEVYDKFLALDINEVNYQ